MRRLDRETVRARSPIVDVIAELTKQAVPSRNGAEVKLRCPFHEDDHPSLRVCETKQTYFCDVCAVGGDVYTFVERVRGCDFREALTFLAERAGICGDGAPAVSPTGEWTYHDLERAPAYKVQRFDPPAGKKTFKQLRADRQGDGSVRYMGGHGAMKDVERVLYRLPDLRGKQTVYIVEGEGCAEALWDIGVAGTTAPGGAGKWLSDKFPIACGGYAAQLREVGVTGVVVLPDGDDPGRRHGDDIARTCHAEGMRVKVATLPDLPRKGDIKDYLTAGHSRTDLLAVAKSTPLYPPPAGQVIRLLPESAPQASPTGDSVPVSSEPIDLATLLTDIMTFVRRYVVMSDEQTVVVALWVAHTHAIAAFDVTPYLNVESATPRAGKTRLFEVLMLIVANAWFTARTSVAALIRKIDKIAPTLLYDERDATFRGDPELAQTLRGILNSGYKKGGTSSQCVGVGAAMTVKDFQTFCPKAIGGIGKLPDTVADRSIPIVLRRRLRKTEPIEKLKPRLARPCAASLMQRLEAWAQTAVSALRDAEPVELDLDNDRAEEVWEPLLSIAALAGPHWLAQARAAAMALSGSHAAEDDMIGIQLLTDIRQVFRQAGDPDVLATKDIREALCAMEDRPWATCGRSEKPITPHALAKRLAEFEVTPAGELWLNSKNVRGYRRAAFEDAWARYCALEPLERYNANEDGTQCAIPQALGPENLADAKTRVQPRKQRLPSVLAVEEPNAGTVPQMPATEHREEEEPWVEV